MPARRKHRNPSFDRALDDFLTVFGPPVQRAADKAVDELFARIHDGLTVKAGPIPEPPPSTKWREIPEPPMHYLVHQRVQEDGETKTRWLLLDTSKPGQTPDDVVEAYMRDTTIRSQTIFRGALWFHADRDRPEPEGS